MFLPGNVIRDEKNVFDVRVNASQLGDHGLMKPGAYLELGCVTADMLHEKIDMPLGDMISGGLSWVLTAAKAEIHKPVDVNCCKLTAVTWLEATRGPFVLRPIEFYSGGDNLDSYEGISPRDDRGIAPYNQTEKRFTLYFYSVLFDINNRTVVRKMPPEIIGKNPGSKEAAAPRLKIPCPVKPAVNRIAQPSDIDCLGHVNNTRYAAFAYDALPREALNHYSSLSGFEIHYRNEMTSGDSFQIFRGEDGINNIYIRGQQEDGKINFEAAFRF